MKKSLLQKLYGGSNRRQHLRLNKHLAWACIGGVTVLIIWLHKNFILIEPWRLNFLYLTPLFCRLQEVWASPDRDLEENRKGIGYWTCYGYLVKHQRRWSHSLLVGTPVRFLYGYWPLLGLILIVPPIALSQAFGLALAGAAISDAGHMMLDRYNPVQMVVGKR